MKGQSLYTLQKDSADSFRMVGPDNGVVLTSSAGYTKGGYRIKDKHGAQLGSLEKGLLLIEGTTYAWKKKSSGFGGDTM